MRDFASILEARYGGSSDMSAQSNVRRVRVRGAACVAKFIVHRSPSGVHAPGGISAKAGFDTEREVYRRLGRSWPVSLVDAFAAHHGPTSGYVIVTTEVLSAPWDTYVPSRARDASIVKQLVRQLAFIHRAGVVHWDLFLKNVLFRPPCSAVIIDFEKSELSTSREDQEAECGALAAEFARRENTRGIAVGMLRAISLAAAHNALARMLAPRA
jgi:serine/threonine protein kinase